MGIQVAVIGGGAAGFFAAISVKHHHRDAEVHLFEKSNKLLAKVKVSGGGRCNVTHACFSPSALSKNYPRGQKPLKKAFHLFQVTETIDWFTARGVQLKTESDNRMFPVSDDSESIIQCLLDEAQKLRIPIHIRQAIEEIHPKPGGFNLDGKWFDKVIVATGGSPKLSGFDWLSVLGHNIIPPVPSLFTFNIPNDPVINLQGVVAPNAIVRIQGTKIIQSGPVLITHWGLSGPAILKCSAWGARALAEFNYQFQVQVNWIGIRNEVEANRRLDAMWENIRKKKVLNACPFDLPKALWLHLIQKVGIAQELPWQDIGKNYRNKIINALLNDVYDVSGKTTFKEEFVTCGGVDLSEVEFSTMESQVVPGLYFAGEVLDIDGVTGGFNFQAAWTTGYIAGKLDSTL